MRIGNLISKDLKTKLYRMALDVETKKLMPKIKQVKLSRQSRIAA